MLTDYHTIYSMLFKSRYRVSVYGTNFCCRYSRPAYRRFTMNNVLEPYLMIDCGSDTDFGYVSVSVPAPVPDP